MYEKSGYVTQELNGVQYYFVPAVVEMIASEDALRVKMMLLAHGETFKYKKRGRSMAFPLNTTYDTDPKQSERIP